jgi:Fe/S biogenesis protein NfuA
MPEKLNVEVTEKAAEMLKAALDNPEFADHAIRVVARRMGASRFQYQMDMEPAADAKDDDLRVEVEGCVLRADPHSAALLEGARIDYVEAGLQGSGFKFHNPLEEKGWEDPIAQRFQEILDAEINPGVASHGGHIELLDYKEGKAFVKMGGGCQGCGQASATLRQGIETRVKELMPEIQEIIDVTDHAAGQNPYYQPGM